MIQTMLISAVLVFHIKAGTGANDWNTAAETIHAVQGDTLRIINDDSVVHALHTDQDRPCAHGTDMAPNGGVYDCVIGDTYDSASEGPLHDHYFTNAHFWLVAQ